MQGTRAIQVRIGIIDERTEEKGDTHAYVIWGHNYLNQRRRFAYDGVRWFYQPTTRARFREVSARGVPLPVHEAMEAYIGVDAHV